MKVSDEPIKAVGSLIGYFLNCLIVMLLWNYLSNSGFWPFLPSGVQTITYMQAMALQMLFNTLVKSDAKKS